jgi:Copper chaperone
MTKYTIDGMKCEGCVKKVKEAFESVAGVNEVDVDLATNTATVNGEAEKSALISSLAGTHYSIKD